MARVQPDVPGPGQESVWDYPRPPRVDESAETVEVWLGGERVALTTRSWRVLETSHPPTYYLPLDAWVAGSLRSTRGRHTTCEWKGRADYFDVLGGGRVAPAAAWSYPEPLPGFEAIRDAVAVMPGTVDRCVVDGEEVTPQPGEFYGGWITSRVVGPFKGAPGTWGW